MVEIFNIEESGLGLFFEIKILLVELCGDIFCQDLAQTTTLAGDVASFLISEAENGNFSSQLQKNLEQCAEECDDLANVSVEGVTFSDVVVVFDMSSPTMTPTSHQPH